MRCGNCGKLRVAIIIIRLEYPPFNFDRKNKYLPGTKLRVVSTIHMFDEKHVEFRRTQSKRRE